MIRALLISGVVFLLASCQSAATIDPLREAAYQNFSAMPAYITVRLQDRQTGESTTMTLANDRYAEFIARLWGVEWPDIYTDAFQERYLAFMIEHDDKPIAVDFAAAREFFNWEGVDPNREQTARFDQPYSLAELGLAGPEDLLDAYFDFDPQTGSGELRRRETWKAETNPWAPRFIALLIELGFYVGRNDTPPTLIIKQL